MSDVSSYTDVTEMESDNNVRIMENDSVTVIQCTYCTH